MRLEEPRQFQSGPCPTVCQRRWAMRPALRIHESRSLRRGPRASATRGQGLGPVVATNSGVELSLSFVGNPSRRDRSDDHAIAGGLELSGGEQGRAPELRHIGQQRRRQRHGEGAEHLGRGQRFGGNRVDTGVRLSALFHAVAVAGFLSYSMRRTSGLHEVAERELHRLIRHRLPKTTIHPQATAMPCVIFMTELSHYGDGPEVFNYLQRRKRWPE
jgi:hypothetical protein